MFDRLTEQKRAINIYVSETDGMQHIHAQRWTLMEDVLKVLRALEELTREISAENVCISTVLPAVMMLKRYSVSSMLISAATPISSATVSEIGPYKSP